MNNKYKYAKKALEITENIFIKTIMNFHSFKTEKDVYDFISNEIKQRRLKPSFDPLVINSGFKEIHRPAKTTKLKRGFCIIDIGVRYKGVCSDMTRTLFLGKPTKKEEELYELVRMNVIHSQDRVKTGMFASELDIASRNDFGKYKKYFTHSLGHGVGNKIHQKPRIHPKSKDKLKEEQIITIEPGLYTSKYGIRIENMVYVGKRKGKLMNKLNTSLIIIK